MPASDNMVTGSSLKAGLTVASVSRVSHPEKRSSSQGRKGMLL